eukprot:4097094-Alexandrium_andersonii.AAC.1
MDAPPAPWAAAMPPSPPVLAPEPPAQSGSAAESGDGGQPEPLVEDIPAHHLDPTETATRSQAA